MKKPSFLALDSFHQRLAGFANKEEAASFFKKIDSEGLSLWSFGSKEDILNTKDIWQLLGYISDSECFPNYKLGDPNKGIFIVNIKDPKESLKTAIERVGEYGYYLIYGKGE